MNSDCNKITDFFSEYNLGTMLPNCCEVSTGSHKIACENGSVTEMYIKYTYKILFK